MPRHSRRWRIKLKVPQTPMQFVRRFRQPGPVLDPGNDPAHRSSRALRLVRKLPVTIVNAPERVVLNASFVFIGLSGFLVKNDSPIVSVWPAWVLVAWAGAMIIGGVSVLVGMFRGLTSVERLGYVLVAPACLLYGISAIAVRGIAGFPVFLIFLGVAAAKLIRLVISSAERDMTIEYGQRMDRETEANKDWWPSG